MKTVKATIPTVTLCVAALACGNFSAHATGFTLDSVVSSYIILYEGGNSGSQLSINNFNDPWTGNIGIAGLGKLAATGPGTLNGNINFAAPNTGQADISNTTINGTVNYGVLAVQTAMNAMNTLSSTFGLQAGSGTSLVIDTHTPVSHIQTVLASSGFLDVNGNRVFNTTSVDTQNGESLIVKGNGSESVVINVNTSGDAQFHGNIMLQDLNGKFYGDVGYAGLTPNQVLFNLYGGAALVGGDTLSANNNGNDAHPANIIEGTFLDPNGAISFVNTRFVGHIFGGDSVNMQIVSGDTITLPAPPSVPDAGSSLLLLSLGMGAVVAAKKKLIG